MPVAPANGIEIFYETIGSSDDEPLLLVRGLGSQMISWRDEFCERIAADGFFVIRFDNRDVGLSSKFADKPQYSLDGMAADAFGLLDHLGVEAAHIAGMSMGGMIVQLMAITRPDRVLSMTSIMSNTGGGPPPTAPRPEILAMFTRPAATNREEAIEEAVDSRRLIAGPGFPFDEDEERELSARLYDRCYDPAGRNRQMAAIQASSSREPELAKLTIPVTVIHGTDDPLVPVAGGERTAEVTPGAKLVLIEGMGHDLPRGAWDQIIGAIVDNARQAART